MPRHAHVALLVALGAAPLAAQGTPVDFSGSFNSYIQGYGHGAHLFPNAPFTANGVTFAIPAGSGPTLDNAWNAHIAADGGYGPVILDVDVGLHGVTTAHTLMNTYWGATTSRLFYAFIEFTGSDGAYYKRDLYGNVDVRDFNNGTHANSINGTTTREAFAVGNVRLDMQTYVLPEAFATQTLERIRLVDFGMPNVQRTFVAGITVEQVAAPTVTPEPATIALLGTGLVALGALARRRRTAPGA